MWKLLLGLLKGGDGRKSVAGGLAWEKEAYNKTK